MPAILDDTLVAILSANAGVRAALGQDPAVYPIKAPEKTPPAYVVYNRNGGDATSGMAGQTGLRTTYFDFTAWALKPSLALAAAQAVFAAFRDYAGYQDATIDITQNVRLNSVLFLGEGDEYDDTNAHYGITYSFQVWYNSPG